MVTTSDCVQNQPLCLECSTHRAYHTSLIPKGFDQLPRRNPDAFPVPASKSLMTIMEMCLRRLGAHSTQHSEGTARHREGGLWRMRKVHRSTLGCGSLRSQCFQGRMPQVPRDMEELAVRVGDTELNCVLPKYSLSWTGLGDGCSSLDSPQFLRGWS